MTIPIREMKGVGAEVVAALSSHGIQNSEQLLTALRTPADRRTMATKLNVDNTVVTEMANRADLARINGIGSVFGDLLEMAGVDTVRELAQRRPDNLHAKIVAVNTANQVAGRLPTLDQVTDWVNQAKSLPTALEY
jgi:predicted flap endonuclease-1-like 5' DNA nuclease